jgi:hypothetical protein
MELPPVELGKQMVALLDANLTLSKPMIADVSAPASAVGGVTDPQAIEQQSQMAPRWSAAWPLARSWRPGRQRRGVGAALRQQ